MKFSKYTLGVCVILLIVFQSVYSVSTNASQQTQQNTEEKIIDYLGLLFTGGVPIVAFLWWIINSQQEKKQLEQNDIIDNKLQELLKNQQQNCVLHQTQFNDMIGRVEDKLDLLSDQFSQEKYETLKKYYDHEAKINEIIKDLIRNKDVRDNIKEIENFLSLKHDYKVRNIKKEVD